MKLEAIDKQMNIEYGGKVYKNNDGVIDVPDSVGNKVIAASNGHRRDFAGKHTPSYAMGANITDEQWNRIFGKKE